MPALVAWLASACSSVLVQMFSAGAARYIAGKLMLTALFVVVLPVVLNNFMWDFINMSMEMVNSSTPANGFNGGMSYSGLAAHYIRLLKVPECMSVMVSALSLRATLAFIPLIRL